MKSIQTDTGMKLQIRIRALSALIVKVYAIWLDGTEYIIQEGRYALSAAGEINGSIQTETIIAQCPNAKLVSVTASIETSTIERGMCYANIELVKPPLTSPFISLVKGYFTYNSPLNFPGDVSENVKSGAGFLHLVDYGDGTIGSNVSPFYNLNRLTRIRALQFNLVTSSVAGNRNPYLGSAEGYPLVYGTQTTVENQTRRYLFTLNENAPFTFVSEAGVTCFVERMNNDVFTSPTNSALALMVNGLDVDPGAGDQITNIYIQCEEWFAD